MAKTGSNKATAAPPKEPNKPAHEIRMGRIRATAWRNVTTEGSVWYSITLQRTYKDKEGAWKSAASYGVDDLLVGAQVLIAMRWWVAKQYQQPAGGAPERQRQNHTVEPVVVISRPVLEQHRVANDR